MRSGEDECLSTVLNECRAGDLSESTCNFLRGLPTAAPIAIQDNRRKGGKAWRAARACSWRQKCADCQVEWQRRNRRLNASADPEVAARELAEEKFKTCVLVAPFNKAVLQF